MSYVPRRAIIQKVDRRTLRLLRMLVDTLLEQCESNERLYTAYRLASTLATEFAVISAEQELPN
jgi:hypothetical protein